jgi:type II restriction enzyme
MKQLDFYSSTINCRNSDQVFDFMVSNLKPSNTLWSYCVNWDKVLENTRKIEVNLNVLNYLIGKVDFDNEFRFLVQKYPETISTIPALVVRDGDNSRKFKILVNFAEKKLVYEDYDFSKASPSQEDIEKYLVFIIKTGIKDLLLSKKIKNLVDYMVGVEAGLDSNARKNRGGESMENIIEAFIADTCKRRQFRYLKEANAELIKKTFGYIVPVDKSSRRYDFVVDNGKECFLIETNFYGGGGSKLKSTAGEYRNLYDVLSGRFKFIWITDGLGWLSTKKPLRETFDHNDFVFNLALLEHGILDSIL